MDCSFPLRYLYSGTGEISALGGENFLTRLQQFLTILLLGSPCCKQGSAQAPHGYHYIATHNPNIQSLLLQGLRQRGSGILVAAVRAVQTHLAFTCSSSAARTALAPGLAAGRWIPQNFHCSPFPKTDLTYQLSVASPHVSCQEFCHIQSCHYPGY